MAGTGAGPGSRRAVGTPDAPTASRVDGAARQAYRTTAAGAGA
ncbi:hypothetical protein SLI_6946 [Streptomyces lividans 1326]|uniref:Uncharacterized protein n=1 Tax=Streptomyces lividans 1326 TaxID=1200984 RepID=A0A7U9E1N1_STRLI|nr:hypothetical protein SLI_6946 [Streptomyces lividans 1326]